MPLSAGRSGMREIGNVVQVPGHPTAPYRMYYSAHMGTYSETAQIEIFMATSLDGMKWTPGTAPIIADRFLEDPYVSQAPDGSWELYAEDKTTSPQKYIRVYRSQDGLSGWTDLGNAGIPVGKVGEWNQLDVSSPVVWMETVGGKQRRYCLFEGRTPGQDGAIGLAWSENPDPTQPWTVHPAPVAIPNNPGFFGAATPVTPWAKVLVPDDITRSNGSYLMLAHAFTLDQRWVPALLTSTDLTNWQDAVSHELVNGTHPLVPAETWMFNGAVKDAVIYTNGQGIYLAHTALEAAQEITLRYDSAITSNRLLLKPGRHVFYDLKITGEGTFGMVRVKDANSGDGGFVNYESNFATRPYPWGVDVPQNAGGGQGYVMDIPCTTSSTVTASFRLISAVTVNQ